MLRGGGDVKQRNIPNCPFQPGRSVPASIDRDLHWWRNIGRCAHRIQLRYPPTRNAKDQKRVSLSLGQPYHDYVHDWNGVQFDMPDVHHTKHIDGNHQDTENDQECRVEIEAKQQTCDKKHRSERQGQIHNQIVPDCQVLIVEHVEDTEKKRRCQFERPSDI